jgi:tyrosine-protein kinase Etk/Wzc
VSPPGSHQRARVELFVSELRARPGTEFRVVRSRRSEVIEQLQQEALKGNDDVAEVSIERYQKTHGSHGSVDVTLETQAAIDRAVDIEKALAETDVQLAELREKFTDSHPVIATLKQKMAQMRTSRPPSSTRRGSCGTRRSPPSSTCCCSTRRRSCTS